MSNVYFSADFHLFHRKIKEYCPHSRKGDNPDQMSEMILNNISEQTNPGDIIYNIGDVSFGTFDQTEYALKQIKKMRVQHHLIFGNHDKKIRDSFVLCDYFDSVQDIKSVTINKQFIVMSHMKMTTYDRARYGAIHLHGHTHSTYQPNFDKSMDVGIDTRQAGDMKMYSLEEVLKIMVFCDNGKHH